MKGKDAAPAIELQLAAVYTNGYSAYVPWQQSIGFRTHSSSYRQQGVRDSVAEAYLINSRNKRHNPENEYSILSFLDDRGMVMVSMNGQEDIPQGKLIALPNSEPLDMALGDAVTRRRSIRSYTGDQISFEFLATMIRSGCAISANVTARLMSEGNATFSFRTVPSAGGLYPIDLYIISRNVEGLAKGVYRYIPNRDALLLERDAVKADQLLETFVVPDEIISCRYANVIFMLVARPWKTMRKYGDRGLRFIFHETGAISQNIHLAATALGLGSVDCASVCDDELHHMMDFDGVFQTLTHTIIVGT